jgi:hypothetical protein
VRNLAASHSQRHDGIVDLDGGPQLHAQQLGQVTLNKRDSSVVIFYTKHEVRSLSYVIRSMENFKTNDRTDSQP